MMLPWSDMLRAGIAAGLTPEAFWRLSLREWRWISARGRGATRQGLEALMTQFPDTEEQE